MDKMTSSGSATGNPRNKTALKPGHSLMDWIRLGASGKVDLTGVGGVPRDVTPQQLAQHATPDDAWLALRGRVYNVTHYLDFHPGGPDELLKGAGKDATDLFNKVHAWVNYESILQKCVVGQLRRDSQGASDELRAAFRAATANRGASVPLLSPTPPTSPAVPLTPTSPPVPRGGACPMPRMDWFQQVTFRKETPGAWASLEAESSVSLPCAAAGPVRSTVKSETSAMPEGASVKSATATAGATVKPAAPTPAGAGAAAAGGNATHELEVDVAQASLQFERLHVVTLQHLTPDVRLIVLRGAGRTLDVPSVGQHVVVRAEVHGVEVSRRYTPVPPYVHPKFKPSDWEPDCLCLMVKGYPNGALSHHLTNLNKDDTVDVSEMDGNFDPRCLASCKKLCLLAAGSGITPMLGIISWAQRQHSGCQPHILLICFNRTHADRMWAEQLSYAAEQSAGQLQVEHVLSQAGPEWSGRRGHVELALLRELLSPPGLGVFVAACGPPRFNHSTECFLRELGYAVEQYHIFEG